MIAAIIQARMDSKRLKGKVLKKILSKPILYYQIERLRRSKLVNNIIIATTQKKSDDSIISFCEQYKVSYFRGNENNVLKRYLDCAKLYKVSNIIRLTADCPLLEVSLLDKMIKLHIQNDYDYTSNNVNGYWPDGLDIEIIKYKTLNKINKIVKINSDKEHVTTYIKKNLNNFKYRLLKPQKNLSYLRLTVDQNEDFILVNEIFKRLYKIKKNFTLEDIIKLFKRNPDLINLNNKIKRNEGLRLSLKND